jgi:predicted kinase
MGKLTVLIGLARSGKSTFASNWQTDVFTSGPPDAPRVIVNSDSIRLAMHGHRYIRESEPFVHAMTKVMVKALHSQGYNVLIDETNTTVGSIRQWLEIDPDATFIYLDTSVEVCQERARATGQDDLVNVIPRMYRNLQETQWYSLGGWEDIDAISHDADSDDFHVTEHRLMKTVELIRNEVKWAK